LSLKLNIQKIKTTLAIPTFNACASAKSFLDGLKKQTYQVDKIIVIDSSSSDDTVAIFKRGGASVHVIPKSSFDHGGTRQMAVDLVPDADVIIFTTQDIIFATDNTIKTLLDGFSDVSIGAVYGRQLPSFDATPIARHARLFNYHVNNSIKSCNDIPQLGMKTAFLSNSFAAYSRRALMSVGGFPTGTIFGEDTQVAAKMILKGLKVAYCAEASVYHSHNLTYIGELRRYFDIGVFHSREKWFVDALGKVRWTHLSRQFFRKVKLHPGAVFMFFCMCSYPLSRGLSTANFRPLPFSGAGWAGLGCG